MAFESPFVEQPFASNPNPTPEQQADIASQWTAKLSDPNVRAMIMQTGLALMQPVGLGQTAAGHVGQAVGQGFEASDRVVGGQLAEREQQRKERDTDSRMDERAARAQVAEARLGTAGAGLDLKRQGLEIARERLNMQSTLGDMQRRIQNSNAYNTYQKEKEKTDQNRMLADPKYKPEPTLSFDEWSSTRGTGALNPVVSGSDQPPSEFPDARKAADGNWYVQRNGRWNKIKQ